ncbi:CD151 antigen isoform X1 [Hydra vulgaris]|uniref:CD151 antigen isoform X1 n=1 Tax=Hydra vulgaris TaxID=6087 RepID=UPI0002B43F09|nr:CD151 antigen [Hydra vulgaris]
MAATKTCVKFFLFGFNVIFWLAGGAAAAIGIWMLFDGGRFNKFIGNYTFTVPASILVAAGLFVFFVGFCGCFGAVKEHKCLLGTYFTMLLLVFCAEIAAGVLAFLYRDKIYDEVTYQSKLVIINDYGTGIEALDYSVNLMQQKFKCCGASGPNDYSAWVNRQGSNKQAPESCCSNPSKCTVNIDQNLLYKTGCVDSLTTFIKENMIILGGIGVGLACVQLLGMCFSCCLFFAIDDY